MAIGNKTNFSQQNKFSENLEAKVYEDRLPELDTLYSQNGVKM